MIAKSVKKLSKKLKLKSVKTSSTWTMDKFSSFLYCNEIKYDFFVL